MLARVIAFPRHRVKRRPSALVFASFVELEEQRRHAARLLGWYAALGAVLTGIVCLIAG